MKTFVPLGKQGFNVIQVTTCYFRLLEEQENQPDVWFRVTQKRLYRKAIEAAASFVGAPSDCVFITNNATFGKLANADL